MKVGVKAGVSGRGQETNLKDFLFAALPNASSPVFGGVLGP